MSQDYPRILLSLYITGVCSLPLGALANISPRAFTFIRADELGTGPEASPVCRRSVGKEIRKKCQRMPADIVENVQRRSNAGILILKSIRVEGSSGRSRSIGTTGVADRTAPCLFYFSHLLLARPGNPLSKNLREIDKFRGVLYGNSLYSCPMITPRRRNKLRHRSDCINRESTLSKSQQLTPFFLRGNTYYRRY